MALDTKSFVDNLIKENYTHLCVVPCSFAKYVINEAINNENIKYVPCASEAVACSVAAGLKMSGKKTFSNSTVIRCNKYGKLYHQLTQTL